MNAVLHIYALGILVLIVGGTSGYHSINLRNSQTKHHEKSLNITKWEQNNLPVPLQEEILENILHKIALYDASRYCPFKGGMQACKRKGANAVINEIILNTLLDTKYPHLKNNKTGKGLKFRGGFRWLWSK